MPMFLHLIVSLECLFRYIGRENVIVQTVFVVPQHPEHSKKKEKQHEALILYSLRKFFTFCLDMSSVGYSVRKLKYLNGCLQNKRLREGHGCKYINTLKGNKMI